MTFSGPANIILRKSVVGDENEWVKMFDPHAESKTDSPPTPELLSPTNPVPEVMAAAGLQIVSIPHTVKRDLLEGKNILTWDGLKNLQFFLMGDDDNPSTSGGTYPAATIRVPRGVVFHGHTHGHGPPPHTIHWHGIEPTPLNDGVGHCSMEVGTYLYQWQPNFIGSYFYHCHRNTPQHFEFGLFGDLLIMPPDAYFATQNDPTIPIGACSDGKFRIAANTSAFPEFPGFIGGDPIFGVGNAADTGVGDPHAFTVPYDVEALWVLDERDSNWSDKAPGAFATFPEHGNIPGVDDDFFANVPGSGFFAFNDFHPDYFFVTGVPVAAPVFGTGTIDPAGPPPAGGGLPGGLIPPALNSGVFGTQIAINAQTFQTILVRCLDSAYSETRITFPLDAVIIAWDGRALGVPPFGKYNHAYKLLKGTPIQTSVARRFDALLRSEVPIQDFATVEFRNTRGNDLMMTAKIPVNIGGAAIGVFAISGRVTRKNGTGFANVTMTLTGANVTKKVLTGGTGNYSFIGLAAGTYTITPSTPGLKGVGFKPKSLTVNVTNSNVTGKNFVSNK